MLIYDDGSCHVPITNYDHDAETLQMWKALAVRNHVRHLESADPGCRIYPRFKSHDDIAAVAVSP